MGIINLVDIIKILKMKVQNQKKPAIMKNSLVAMALICSVNYMNSDNVSTVNAAKVNLDQMMGIEQK